MDIIQGTYASIGVYNAFKNASDGNLEGYSGELELIQDNLSQSEASSRITEVNVFMKRYEALCSVVSKFFSFQTSTSNKVEFLFPDDVMVIIKSPSVDITLSNEANIKAVAGEIYSELLIATSSYYEWSNASYFLKPTVESYLSEQKISAWGENLPL